MPDMGNKNQAVFFSYDCFRIEKMTFKITSSPPLCHPRLERGSSDIFLKRRVYGVLEELLSCTPMTPRTLRLKNILVSFWIAGTSPAMTIRCVHYFRLE